MIVNLYKSLVPLAAAQRVNHGGRRSAVPVLSLAYNINVIQISLADIAEALSFSLVGDGAGVTIFVVVVPRDLKNHWYQWPWWVIQ